MNSVQEEYFEGLLPLFEKIGLTLTQSSIVDRFFFLNFKNGNMIGTFDFINADHITFKAEKPMGELKPEDNVYLRKVNELSYTSSTGTIINEKTKVIELMNYLVEARATFIEKINFFEISSYLDLLFMLGVPPSKAELLLKTNEPFNSLLTKAFISDKITEEDFMNLHGLPKEMVENLIK